MGVKTWNLEQNIFFPLFFLDVAMLPKSSSDLRCLERHVEFRIDVCLSVS